MKPNLGFAWIATFILTGLVVFIGMIGLVRVDLQDIRTELKLLNLQIIRDRLEKRGLWVIPEPYPKKHQI